MVSRSEKLGALDSGGMHGLDRIVAVLDALQAAPGSTLAMVGRAAGLSEPTALRYLTALCGHRLVLRDEETSTYSLGVKLFELGQSALGSLDPRKAAVPILEGLRDEFGETAEMGMWDGARLVLVEARVAKYGVVKGATVGDVDPWHSTSLGKSILAGLDPAEARALLSGTPLERFTSRTLTDLDELELALKRVRQAGYAIDDEESEEGLRCVGAAVRDASGAPKYAISVSGPTYRLTLAMVPEIAEAVQRAAQELSRRLGGPAEPARPAVRHVQEGRG